MNASRRDAFAAMRQKAARREGRTSVRFALREAEQHRPREGALRRWQRVEKSERQPARPAHERNIVAEQIDEAVGERDARPAIGPAAARFAAGFTSTVTIVPEPLSLSAVAW